MRQFPLRLGLRRPTTCPQRLGHRPPTSPCFVLNPAGFAPQPSASHLNTRLNGRSAKTNRAYAAGYCRYGGFFDFNRARPGKRGLVPPFPPILNRLVETLVDQKRLLPADVRPDSVIINAYEPGDCIPPHVDHGSYYRCGQTDSAPISNCSRSAFREQVGCSHRPLYLPCSPCRFWLSVSEKRAFLTEHTREQADLHAVAARRRADDDRCRPSSILALAAAVVHSARHSRHSPMIPADVSNEKAWLNHAACCESMVWTTRLVDVFVNELPSARVE